MDAIKLPSSIVLPRTGVIYIYGATGTGKTNIVKKILEQVSEEKIIFNNYSEYNDFDDAVIKKPDRSSFFNELNAVLDKNKVVVIDSVENFVCDTSRLAKTLKNIHLKDALVIVVSQRGFIEIELVSTAIIQTDYKRRDEVFKINLRKNYYIVLE